MPPIDLIVLGILLLAALRGLTLGLLREAFSIGAVAGAVMVVRVWTTPFAEWLVAASAGELGESTAPWVAGGLLAVVTLVAVGTFGRFMQRGARAVGLGWADRAGGAALGAAEGAIAAALLLLAIGWMFGREHTFLAESRSIELLERFEQVAAARSSGDVAAPPSG